MNRFLDVVFNLPAPGPFTYELVVEDDAAAARRGTAAAGRGSAATKRRTAAANRRAAQLETDGADSEERPARTAANVGIGYRVKAPFGKRSLVGIVVGAHDERGTGDYTIRPIERVIDAEPLFDEAYLELARWVAGMYFCSLGEAFGTMLPVGRRESRTPIFEDEVEERGRGEHALTEHQSAAIRAILDGSDRSSYLYGVTGSGKTEVFLTAAERVLEQGLGVIYLVPEISLTHQLVEIVRARFSGRVAVLHSGLTPSQKLVEWMRIRRGDAPLVIGARSAVFAPVPKLGLVVIDEEHEGSYKSGSTPRYHARQVAMRRCATSGSKLVMGSATPSLEAVHLMSEGRIARRLLPERVSGGSMPRVTVVDMRREEGPISRPLAEAILRAHDEGRQTILFLNRRGFSYFFHCRSCGYEMVCRHCSVALTFHKDRNRMICHYCGYSRPPVEACPECGSLDVGYSGFGTENIEEDIARRFPELRTVRVDTDSIRRKGSLRSTLRAFRDHEIDLLLGTQMVAKGLNFPGVKLVGIVLADTGLHLPDFRAQERTFSLIVQVSGRAGRYIPDGEVIVQTFRPENEAVRLAASNQADEFYRRELEVRRALHFPPFSRLVRLVFRGRDREHVAAAAEQYAAALGGSLARASGEHGSIGELLGPAECPISIISGNHRLQLIVRTTSFAHLHPLIAASLARFKPPHDVYVEVDVDPVGLL